MLYLNLKGAIWENTSHITDLEAIF